MVQRVYRQCRAVCQVWTTSDESLLLTSFFTHLGPSPTDILDGYLEYPPAGAESLTVPAVLALFDTRYDVPLAHYYAQFSAMRYTRGSGCLTDWLLQYRRLFRRLAGQYPDETLRRDILLALPKYLSRSLDRECPSAPQLLQAAEEHAQRARIWDSYESGYPWGSRPSRNQSFIAGRHARPPD